MLYQRRGGKAEPAGDPSRAGRLAIGMAAAAASGAALFYGTGLHPIPALTWVAPAPVVAWALGERRGWLAAALSALAWVLGGLNLLRYLARLAPLPAVLLALAGPALVFAACVLLARAAARARTSLEAVLVLPLAWTGFEWILASFSPHGTFGSLAYSQMNFLPALQMAALVGHVGITFLVALASSGLAFAWHLRRQPRRAAATLGTAALVVGLSLGWGAARLRDRAPGPALRVGLAAADSTIRWFRTLAPDTTLAIVRGCTERIDRLAASGARLVVLPEKIVGVPDAAADSALALLRRAAERNRITIVAGFNRRSARFARNIAWVVSRGGVATYDKAHPVPGFEDDYEIGREPLVLADRTPRLGVAICKDMDFPDWTLRYARRGVDVLAVPAWDFGEDGWLHSRMAILRGVEGGFSVARCAQDGRLTLSDPFGHVTAEQASSDAPEVLVTGSVPAIGIVTPLREGWGLGWVLGLAGLFVACPLRLPRGSRAAAASGESRPPAIASPEIEEEL